MDVDYLGYGDEDWMEEGDEDAEMVDEVRNMKCYECGEFGHLARECPTRSWKGGFKGKGKDKGGGKGSGKGFKGYIKDGFKGKGNDSAKGKGKGKGKYGNAKGFDGKGGKGFEYQGTCWTCGIVGHKSNECPH